MIELCTKKRMLIGITLLGGLVSRSHLIIVTVSYLNLHASMRRIDIMKRFGNIRHSYICSHCRLTVLVLIVESHWTDSSNKLYLENYENNATCMSGDEYEITSECHPCTAFEIASKSIDVCVHARYKEVLKCRSGETITRR